MSQVLLALMLLKGLPQSSGSITGQILSTSGSPAASVRVSAMPSDAQAANLSVLTAFAVTDSTGRYKIDNVEAGTYYVIAGLIAQPTYYPGVATQAAARTVTVAQGASITGLDFKIVTSLTPAPPGLAARPVVPPPPTFTVSGRVALKPGQLLPTSLWMFSFPRLSEIRARPDGSFEVTGVPSGSYSFGTSFLVRSDSPNVVVSDKDVTGVTVSLPLNGRVTGKIESRAGLLTESISFWLVEAANPTNRVGVSSANSFEVDLLEGDYRIVPEVRPGASIIESVSVGGVKLQGGAFTVAQNTTGNLVVTVVASPIDNSARAAALLRDLSGKLEREGPAANALVGLRFSDASGPLATVMIDASIAEPSFRVALPIGEYKVEVLLPASGNQPNPLRVKSVTYGASDILSMPMRVTEQSTDEIRIAIGPLQ
jgi:Carboxypeptidase regulatory-like domain